MGGRVLPGLGGRRPAAGEGRFFWGRDVFCGPWAELFVTKKSDARRGGARREDGNAVGQRFDGVEDIPDQRGALAFRSRVRNFSNLATALAFIGLVQ